MSRAQLAIIVLVLFALLIAPDSVMAAPVHHRSEDMFKRAASQLESASSLVPREVAATVLGVFQRRGVGRLTSAGH
ncbi:hypothetical protein L208DRAFT_1405574 [Tricholoma matsutake]|nr:hypothetical protein L208DRAFT_1405574 [Tricholoma matsutake 945]